MNKQILIISGSPRQGGNSDTLCDQFQKGCEEAGHSVTKVCLRDKQINFAELAMPVEKLGYAFKRTMFLTFCNK